MLKTLSRSCAIVDCHSDQSKDLETLCDRKCQHNKKINHSAQSEESLNSEEEWINTDSYKMKTFILSDKGVYVFGIKLSLCWNMP